MYKLKEYGIKCENKGSLLTILIGSLARGDYTPFSDADIIIITKSRLNIIDFMDTDMPVDIEPRLYTLNEILNMSKEKRKIIYEIIKNGILLSGNKDLMKKINDIYYG